MDIQQHVSQTGNKEGFTMQETEQKLKTICSASLRVSQHLHSMRFGRRWCMKCSSFTCKKWITTLLLCDVSCVRECLCFTDKHHFGALKLAPVEWTTSTVSAQRNNMR